MITRLTEGKVRGSGNFDMLRRFVGSGLSRYRWGCCQLAGEIDHWPEGIVNEDRLCASTFWIRICSVN